VGLFRRLAPWVAKGSFTVADQAAISGSNFVISILLGRWLSPSHYGAYALAFAIFILLTRVYQALLLEPLAIFGGSAYEPCLQGYIKVLVRIHLAMTALIVVALGLGSVLAHYAGHTDGLAGALAGVTLATPCVLLFWMARRAFYFEISPARAALGSLIYFVMVVAGLFWGHARGWIGPFTAFLLMGVAAALTAVFLFRQLAHVLPVGRPGPHWREVWRRHWGYGRWALAASIASWLPAYFYYPLLGAVQGMASAGELKALMNLVSPVNQTLAALSMLFIPHAARVHGRHGTGGSRGLSVKLTLVTVGMTVAYWVVVILLKRPVFDLFYGAKYLGILNLVPVVAVGSLLWSAAHGPSIVLRGMESPQSLFFAYAAASGISLLIGIPATWRFGLAGGVWGMNISDAVSFVMVLWLLGRKPEGIAAT
jgi:O-antigen/teichoic acid export membrane protein